MEMSNLNTNRVLKLNKTENTFSLKARAELQAHYQKRD